VIPRKGTGTRGQYKKEEELKTGGFVQREREKRDQHGKDL